jgi:hypothetical protein
MANNRFYSFTSYLAGTQNTFPYFFGFLRAIGNLSSVFSGLRQNSSLPISPCLHRVSEERPTRAAHPLWIKETLSPPLPIKFLRRTLAIYKRGNSFPSGLTGRLADLVENSLSGHALGIIVS